MVLIGQGKERNDKKDVHPAWKSKDTDIHHKKVTDENPKNTAWIPSQLDEMPVAPRGTYIVAGKKLLQQMIHNDAGSDNAWIPPDWREKMSEARLLLCQEAAAELGYILHLQEQRNADESGFRISVESYGFKEHQDGKIHIYAVSAINRMEDCLQLVADFSAIGLEPITHYRNRQIRLQDTGKLRRELEKWNLAFKAPENKPKKESFEEKVKSAASRSASSRMRRINSRTEPER